MTNTRYERLTKGLIGFWFIASAAASALRLFTPAPHRPPLILGIAVLAPIVLFLWWFATSKSFREFALALNPRTLVLAHTWRIGGLVFLVLYSYGILPAILALPAGWGDILIGATAPLVASKLADPSHPKAFILWQVLGITDLVMAITLGTTAKPAGIQSNPMAVLPLSLIPTFAVPLLLILHVISIAQARRWLVQKYPRVDQPIPSSAA